MSNIGLFGNSYGGLLCVIQAIKHQFRFLVCLSPRTDVRGRFDDDPTINIDDWRAKGIIDIIGNRMHISLYDEEFPITDNDIKTINTKTLIIHGDKDEVVPYKQSVHLHELINGSDFITIKDCGHMSYKYGKMGFVLQSISDWVKKINGEL